jgi:23S rRNA pseudouridine1911/1915/1917 synthase
MGLSNGEFVVGEGVNRRPLDGVLRGLIGEVSWGDVRQVIETGKVQVNGVIVTDGRRYVSAGDAIKLTMSAPRVSNELRLGREVIAYEDADVVVVRKPSGMNSVPFDEGETGTLDQMVRALLSRERRARGGPAQGWIGVVHRLDRETTGLLVFARTLLAKKHLGQQFRDHTVHRRYVSIVHGALEREREFRSYICADRGDGLRGTTGIPGQGQLAVTHVKPTETLQGATLVECRLETGRTHQIRIHLSEAGHPVLGEKVYIRNYSGAIVRAPRVMLHARELGFEHPRTGRTVMLEEPMPADMCAVRERLLA